ncbi:MAG: nucleoside recognition domain-containing protein, partial [Thermoplasmata archaeon]
MECEIDERWKLVDRIAEETVTYGDGKTTLKDAIAELTVKPLTGLPIALAVLYGFWSFFSAFAGFFTDGFFVRLFDNHWLPWLQGVFPGKGRWYYFILVGDPAAGNSFEAFGMLTSGLFVAIGIVLPAITAFYLYLIILEDSGYMPRLAVLIDTLLHKIGLHGFAIVPMIL